MTPQAKAVPHPHIEGAWTLEDPMAPRNRPLMFASKASAEAAAAARNKERRTK